MPLLLMACYLISLTRDILFLKIQFLIRSSVNLCNWDENLFLGHTHTHMRKDTDMRAVVVTYFPALNETRKLS